MLESAVSDSCVIKLVWYTLLSFNFRGLYCFREDVWECSDDDLIIIIAVTIGLN